MNCYRIKCGAEMKMPISVMQTSAEGTASSNNHKVVLL